MGCLYAFVVLLALLTIGPGLCMIGWPTWQCLGWQMIVIGGTPVLITLAIWFARRGRD